MKKIYVFFLCSLLLITGLIINFTYSKSIANTSLHHQFLKENFDVVYDKPTIENPTISKQEAIDIAYKDFKEEFALNQDIKLKAYAEHVVKIPAGGGPNNDVWAVTITGGKFNEEKFNKDPKFKNATINSDIWVDSTTGKVIGAVAYDSRKLDNYKSN